MIQGARHVRGQRLERTGKGSPHDSFSKRSAAILVTSLFASLLVVSGPALGVDGRPDNLPDYSACVGPATASARFVDTEGHFAKEAIDCLAYYGITLGTTPNRFSPNEPISRWQMALFLTRAAGPAGITLPPPTDQGFVDLDTRQGIQDAINQIAAVGITKGTSPTTFHPHAPMDRRQMALFLHRFLKLAPKGPAAPTSTESLRTTPYSRTWAASPIRSSKRSGSCTRWV